MSEKDSSARKAAAKAKRIVVKIGTSTLTRNGELQPRMFGSIARQVTALMDGGREVVIVSMDEIRVLSEENRRRVRHYYLPIYIGEWIFLFGQFLAVILAFCETRLMIVHFVDCGAVFCGECRFVILHEHIYTPTIHAQGTPDLTNADRSTSPTFNIRATK